MAATFISIGYCTPQDKLSLRTEAAYGSCVALKKLLSHLKFRDVGGNVSQVLPTAHTAVFRGHPQHALLRQRLAQRLGPDTERAGCNLEVTSLAFSTAAVAVAYFVPALTIIQNSHMSLLSRIQHKINGSPGRYSALGIVAALGGEEMFDERETA